ncbi:MAG TPA: NAD(P)(+) transhydrogenase (Re/Si-specific) subunit beta, partial [Umezawaea sp.]|nr:NAD(P)(+) transhydrogenase (Re/Si-specific) subunit beta [Umezawaea sp.]
MSVQLAYLVAALCFLLALKGLSTPRFARAGNLLGAAGMLLAVVTAFLHGAVHNGLWILVAIALGAVVGVPAARSVKMTAIPQMVALFNGVGGAAAALVALVFGVLFVLPVGGADVPVVISLLNAFTGLAVAASGAVLRMTLLIVAGTLVGASGTLLTQL